MPRRTAKQKNKEKRIALGLTGAVLVALLTVVMAVAPGVSDWLFGLFGVRQNMVVPATGVESPTAVHVVDVGQGDAILLEESGEFALMDAGPPEGADDLLAYLKAAGVERLRYVFMTHPHADHIGGMEAVVRDFPTELVVLPDFELMEAPAGAIFAGLLEEMARQDIPAETAAQNAVYPLGAGQVRVVHAGVESVDDYNHISLGLMFQAGDFRCLNTGDAEKVNERAMLESGQDLEADVFIAGHHGSYTSNGATFVAAVRPKLVVVSCAAGNSYGHPHKSALESFENAGAQVLRCDRAGTVVAQPAGEGRVAAATEEEALAAQSTAPKEAA